MTNLITNTVLTLFKAGRTTKNTSGGWISGNAPCCHHRGERPDTRKRGGLMLTGEGFVWHCFNCGFKAGWQPGKLLSKNTKDLFLWMNLSEDEIKKLSLDALRQKDETFEIIPNLNFDLKELELPKDSLPIITWIEEGCEEPELLSVIEYIYSRGLTLHDYNWHWTPENGYRDRVLIPFYYEKQIVGWTGRKIENGKPKYLSSAQKSYVFNLDNQTHDRIYTIVVEGIFDAISIDGVAIMSNEPNEEQCIRINALDKEIIVVPDRDKAGAKLLEAAVKYGWNMSSPPWEPDVKDVADAVNRYGKLYTLATILHYKESNQIKIEIQKKKLEGINV